MTREYATQMEAARKGIVTKEMEIVAKKERMTTEELLPLVASGKVAICANKNHKCIDPEGVGSMLKTKINVNLGVSRDCTSVAQTDIMVSAHIIEQINIDIIFDFNFLISITSFPSISTLRPILQDIFLITHYPAD